MKRRKFLKNIGKISAAPILLNGVGLQAMSDSSMLNFLTTCIGVGDRSIVVLFLKGGNDGLNTIIPIDQYSTYIGHRPTIGLPDSGAGAYINLDTTLSITDQVGIHPAMANFKSMYEAGKARMIQAVGYPTFNQSHFGSSDLWLGGRDGSQGVGASGDGWIGRFFENAYPGIHSNPNIEFPDPLGVQLGDRKASLAFHDCSSVYEAVNISGQDPAALYGLLNGLGTAPHDTPLASEYGYEIDYITDVENSTNVYGQRITDVYNAGTNSNVVYPNSSLGNQLTTVAKLLSGGSKTKVFQLHRGGFDTHSNQVVAGSTSTGNHANLLGDVFNSIKAFHDDLTNLGVGNKVVTVVFSEFSRRITENGSIGTDHGNYGPMFIFGDAVEPGISGTNFDLTAINGSGNMNVSEMQYDYRSVLKTLLQDWMGAGSDILIPTQLDSYPLISGLIESNEVVDPSCYLGSTAPLPIELKYFEAYLNDEQKVELEWATSSEIDTQYFEIIRQQDNEEILISRVEAKGDNITTQVYDAIDENPLIGISYYKLRSVDIDGAEQHSDWHAIEIKEVQIEHIKIYPNPAIYDFNLVLTTSQSRIAILEMFDFSGKMVRSVPLNIEEGFNKFRVEVADLPIGQYIVKINSEEFDIAPLQVLVHR
ncbi:MAG: DUF1501 domain-containing protein [Saprospiraceae bacterium]|nr:DUF1501 domain-containing protein [Saprospiraceae bacterium]